jgi:lysophospholipase-2
MSYEVLKDKLEMPNVEFHTYKGMAHSASNEELLDLAKWLKNVLPAETGSADGSSI